jgi:hypothetical protein
MNIKAYIPTAPEIVRESIVAVFGVLLAAFVISRVPALRHFVQQNSLVVKDQSGNVLY